MAFAENPEINPAHSCQTMAQVRDGIDAIDRQIVQLIAARTQFIAAAARIKSDRGRVRDTARIADVHAKTTAVATRVGVPPDIVHATYAALMEASIAHEMALFDAKADGPGAS